MRHRSLASPIARFAVRSVFVCCIAVCSRCCLLASQLARVPLAGIAIGWSPFARVVVHMRRRSLAFRSLASFTHSRRRSLVVHSLVAVCSRCRSLVSPFARVAARTAHARTRRRRHRQRGAAAAAASAASLCLSAQESQGVCCIHFVFVHPVFVPRLLNCFIHKCSWHSAPRLFGFARCGAAVGMGGVVPPKNLKPAALRSPTPPLC